MSGKPGRSGPKPGNKNALKNGSRVDHRRLVVGELPANMIAVKREARAYRRELEAVVMEAKGRIDMQDAHIIDAATGCTLSIGINRWLLRHRLEKMTVSDINSCNKEMRTAKKERAAIVRALGLDDVADPLALLYAPDDNDSSGNLEDK